MSKRGTHKTDKKSTIMSVFRVSKSKKTYRLYLTRGTIQKNNEK